MEKFERGTCFIETKEKDIITLKGATTVTITTTEVIVEKKGGLSVKLDRKDLVSVWFRKETCYDFSQEGGEA